MKCKKFLAAAAACLMVAGLAACGNEPSTPSNPDEKVFQIGIVQLAEHPALDEATRGFKEFLTEKLGDKVQFSVQNAQGEQTNCTTIVTLVAINALAKESPIETIIASSYQAVSGAGKGGIDELNNEVKALSEGKHLEPKVFQYQIAYNIIPQIGGEAFEGYTSEEMKMQNEGRKILHLPEMKVSCTCARVPVIRSHSVSVVLRTKEKISVERARELIANAPGCKLVDDLKNKVYPMPLDTSDQDIVYVGRIREDLTDERGLNLWCCGDQVRKGAATNTIQIAELLLK